MQIATRERHRAWLEQSRFFALRAAREACVGPLVERIERELSMMQRVLGCQADVAAFQMLDQWTRFTLNRIADLLAQGLIDPAASGGRGPVGRRERLDRRPLRLGVFPTAGNPLHWGHLLSGLAAMERFRLDKVVYVIAGDDPRKPDLAPANLRHSIAKEVLGLFHPLFEYSPIALGGAAPGEVNVFRIMGRDTVLPLHVFYIAGSDHYRRFSPETGCADTIQRLEEGVRRLLHGFLPRAHVLSAVFLGRGNQPLPVETFLDVQWIDCLPLNTSSTRIRHAIGGQLPLCELSALPFTGYRAIFAHGAYRLAEGEDSLAAAQCPSERRTEDMRGAI